ncbi:hypothetical protein ARHIZOSPH14_31760 [Agromyces rhizosphaerae]|uniref:HdeD family acid-resistance protein n=1 Tax=Agromyces rhizosphaerae TaxID=88374 RepID=A0A9W6FQD1_9MICO|nr:DUF308 domain-containing protein [Agromyces rhizosphaerae]GLI28934.1 hypothetical protein ARHIZOSPH14_31760 [Agromyces rhizosphaerae]
MSSPQPTPMFASFTLDADTLTKTAVNGVRAALGISGVIALILGVLITFWPKGAVVAITVMLAVYLLIAGLVYLGVGVFSRGLKGGARALDIILGLLFVVAAVLAFANLAATAEFLAIFMGVLIGIVWIIEGVVALAQAGDSTSKGWTIFFGILSIVAGIVLLFSPMLIEVIFIVLGIGLIILGIVQVVRAFTFGRDVTA